MDEQNVLASVEFHGDGLSLTYVRYPKDVRQNGLAWQHRVLVPHGSDYDDEIEAVVDALEALLADVLDDEDRAAPIDPDEEEEEDDDDE